MCLLVVRVNKELLLLLLLLDINHYNIARRKLSEVLLIQNTFVFVAPRSQVLSGEKIILE